MRADLITGVVLVSFGLAVLAESYGMPRLEERSINPWTAPGVVPGLLGIVIAVLGAALALRSLASGAWRRPPAGDNVDEQEARAARLRLGLCFALCFVYAVVLVGRLPFWLATGLYVFSFVAAFEWQRGDVAAARARKLAVAGALAGVCAVAIPYLFDRLFLVRLP